MYSVYALTDPRNESICYIGMSRNVWRRYAMHLLMPGKTTPAKNAWIEELKKIDLAPLLKILETIETMEEAGKQETYWIRHYLSLNAPLVNMAKTGKAFPTRQKNPKITMPEVPPNGGYLMPEEIAQTSGVSTDTVLRLIKRKELRAYKISGVYRIKPEDLQQYLDTKRTS